MSRHNRETYRDQGFNPSVGRAWSSHGISDGPAADRCGEMLPIGAVVPSIMEKVIRARIGAWLDAAAKAKGKDAVVAFNAADQLRRELKIDWNELVCGQKRAA